MLPINSTCHSDFVNRRILVVFILLRQYLPKDSDLSGFAQEELDENSWKLNTRPRKSLGFKSPAEILAPGAFDFKLHHVCCAFDNCG